MRSGKPVERVAVVTHSEEAAVADAVSRLERLAESKGVEVTGEDGGPDLAVTLGGRRPMQPNLSPPAPPARPGGRATRRPAAPSPPLDAFTPAATPPTPPHAAYHACPIP